MTYGHFKDLPRRTTADKAFCNNAFNVAKNSRYNEYQCGLASMVYKFFDKKTFNRNKGTSFIDNIWDVFTINKQI